MKKTTRVLVALLALTLVTSCFVGGTFAKYVSTADGTDTARVAHWGVTIATTGDMFGQSYKDAEVGFLANEEVDTITVQSSTDDKVIAPGTNGTLAAYTVTGTPEVDTEVTYTAELTLADWGDYCPIIFTVNGTEYKVDGSAITDAAALETAVEAAIVAETATYHTNQDLSAVNDDVVVTWAWPYSTSTENDVKDTALGDAAAAGNAASITLATTATITQVD